MLTFVEVLNMINVSMKIRDITVSQPRPLVAAGRGVRKDILWLMPESQCNGTPLVSHWASGVAFMGGINELIPSVLPPHMVLGEL